jgi:hypothetical protein
VTSTIKRHRDDSQTHCEQHQHVEEKEEDEEEDEAVVPSHTHTNTQTVFSERPKVNDPMAFLRRRRNILCIVN